MIIFQQKRDSTKIFISNNFLPFFQCIGGNPGWLIGKRFAIRVPSPAGSLTAQEQNTLIAPA